MTPAAPALHASDRGRAWLRTAMAALALLAAAAAAVSWDAQYLLVRHIKHAPAIAALEAGIPDVGALIFATLGIALALHAKHAVRARTLNIACVGISLAMNALASAPGWRDLAVWIMPSAVYAVASDTLIGVVRAWAVARAHHTGQVLAEVDATPMAILGGFLLWLLRLALAPVSTIAGFRRWVDEDTRGGFTHGGWGPRYDDEVLGREMAKAMAKPGDMLLGQAHLAGLHHRLGTGDRRQPVHRAHERDHQIRRLDDPGERGCLAELDPAARRCGRHSGRTEGPVGPGPGDHRQRVAGANPARRGPDRPLHAGDMPADPGQRHAAVRGPGAARRVRAHR